MKNYLLLILALFLSPLLSSAADNLLCDPSGSNCTLIDTAGTKWRAAVGFTTNGAGDIFTLGDVASTDNIIGVNSSSNRTLIDNLGRRWAATVLYTTDGSGHVIPVPTGGGGGAAWGAITGTLSDQTDLQAALNAKQATLTPGNASTSTSGVTVVGTAATVGPAITVDVQTASNSQPGLLSAADHTSFAAKQSALPVGTTLQYLRGDLTDQTLNTSVVPEGSNLYFTNARANAALPQLSAFYVSKVGADSGSCGTISSPCLTISQALTNIGDSASAADVKKPKIVFIDAGAYDEALTIPRGRILTLVGHGTVIIGDGAGANWASTTPRSVTATWNSADVFGSDIKPALNIMATPASDATSTFIAEAGSFFISGNLVINGDGLTNTLNTSSVKVAGTLTHATAALTNWQSYRSIFTGAVTTTGNLVLERAYDSRFNALVSINAYNMVANCNFAAGMTVQSIQQNVLPNGMFFTNFAGTFTGPANSLRLDQTSDFYFRTNSASLAGGATKVLLASSSSASITGPLSSTDWSTFNGKQDALSTSSAVANQFLTGFTAPNTFSRAQPAFSNLSGSISAAQMLALPSANFYVGNGSNQPVAVAMSGEASLANTGAVTLSNAAVMGKVLTGFIAGAGVVASTDTILQAFDKIVGNQSSYLPLAGGTMSGSEHFADGAGIVFDGTTGSISGSTGLQITANNDMTINSTSGNNSLSINSDGDIGMFSNDAGRSILENDTGGITTGSAHANSNGMDIQGRNSASIHDALTAYSNANGELQMYSSVDNDATSAVLDLAAGTGFFIDIPVGDMIFKKSGTSLLDLSDTEAAFSVPVSSSGGVQLKTSGAQPTCDAAHRGMMWNVEGGAGVADLFQVCQKTALDTYVWVNH